MLAEKIVIGELGESRPSSLEESMSYGVFLHTQILV